MFDGCGQSDIRLPMATLPERPISTHPNLVTRSGFQAVEQAVADSGEALRTAQLIEDLNERRRALELAARDARYFSERRCQSNGRSSAPSATRKPKRPLGREGAPLGQRGRTSVLVDLAGDEMPLLIEMIVDLGVN
jgi:hypothetical protein